MEDSSIMNTLSRLAIALVAITLLSTAHAAAQEFQAPVYKPAARAAVQPPAPAPAPVVTDSDKDGVADKTDNCMHVANADQKDTDGDGIGDLCDSTPGTTTNDFPWFWLLVVLLAIAALIWLLSRKGGSKSNRATGGGPDPAEPRLTPRDLDSMRRLAPTPHAAPAPPPDPQTERVTRTPDAPPAPAPIRWQPPAPAPTAPTVVRNDVHVEQTDVPARGVSPVEELGELRTETVDGAATDRPDPDLSHIDLDTDTAAPAAAPATEPAVDGKKTIVVASDRGTTLYHLEEGARKVGLRNNNVEIKKHESLEPASIMELNPDLVIIDTRLTPSDQGDGYTLAANLPLVPVLLIGSNVLPVDVAKAREAHVLGILPDVHTDNQEVIGEMLKEVLAGNRPANLWPEEPATGGVATLATAIIAFVLGFSTLAGAQTIKPAAITVGNPASSFTIEANNDKAAQALLKSCIPSDVIVQPGVVVSLVSQTGDGKITFRAEAKNVPAASMGPTMVHVKCANGSSMNVTPFAVLTDGENYVGAMTLQRLAAELKSRDQQIAALRNELTKKASGVDLKKIEDRLTAVETKQTQFVTVTQLDAKLVRSEAAINNRLNNEFTTINANNKTTATTLEKLSNQVAAVQGEMDDVRDALIAIGAVVDPMAPKVKSGGFLGIGRKQVVPQDALEAMRANIAAQEATKNKQKKNDDL